MKRHQNTQVSPSKRLRKGEPVVGFSWLPVELWVHLAGYLQEGDVIALRRCCLFMRNAVDDYGLLLHLLRKKYRCTFLQQLSDVAQLESWKWTHEQLSWTEKEITTSTAVRSAAVKGHLPLCKWLCSTFHVPEEYVRHVLFGASARAGQISICKWLHKSFQLTSQDIRLGGNHAVRTAASHGHLRLCKWLCRTFSLCSRPRTLYHNLFRKAFSHGQLAVCKWLDNNFRINVNGMIYDNLDLNYDVSEQTRLSLYQWLHQVASIFVQQKKYKMFTDTAKRGHLVACQWLYATVSLTVDEGGKELSRAFSYAISGCYLSLCWWIHDTFPSLVLSKHYAFAFVPESTFLAMVRWLHSTYPQWIEEKKCFLLDSAASQGHDAVCTWLYGTVQLTADHVRSSRSLYSAASGGHLSTCLWLYTTFPLTLQDIEHLVPVVLKRVAEQGYLDVCQWLYTWAPDQVTAGKHDALCQAATGGQLSMCQWLHSVFAYTREEVQHDDHKILARVIFWAALSTCQWLCTTFSFTAADVEGMLNQWNYNNDCGLWLRDHFQLSYPPESL